MKKTISIDLEVFQKLVNGDAENIGETDNRFIVLTRLGGGAVLKLLCPKELPIESPGMPVNPIAALSDVGDTLARHFGGEYEQCAASVICGTYIPREGEEPESFDIAVGSPSAAPFALVELAWDPKNPPQNVGLESEFAQRCQAIYYHRVDIDDRDSSYSNAHGTDLWIMPMASLGKFRTVIEEYERARNSSIDLEIRRYQMDKAFYKQLFHEEDSVAKALGWTLDYGPDSATLTVSVKGKDETLQQTYYYNSGCLKCLHDVIGHGLKLHVLNDMFDIFADL